MEGSRPKKKKRQEGGWDGFKGPAVTMVLLNPVTVGTKPSAVF